MRLYTQAQPYGPLWLPPEKTRAKAQLNPRASWARDGWAISTDTVGPVIAGVRAATSQPPARRPNAGAGPIAPSCARALARFHGFVTYQPAGRYWTFQGIETSIFVALAAILLTVTAVLLLRRDA